MPCPPYSQKIKIYGIVVIVFFLLLGIPTRFTDMPANSVGVSGLMPGVVSSSASPWVSMPAGAKYAYIGIHGGTVPVSLLTSSDGQAMVTLVGRTGNDFLSLLRTVTLHGSGSIPEHANPPERNATILMADTAIGNVPVFYHTGMGFARMDLDTGQWLPFGLSEKPLSLEGQAGRTLPQAMSQTGQGKHKKYRRIQWQLSSQRPVLASQ